ncbi:hypothetical protein V1503_19240 [Bacillus sp. SCS-151]|uniref:hypothetical protein n=1 Tax=Nanhaiella sioensis TaxID=3115293 RepID=UPI00397C7619
MSSFIAKQPNGLYCRFSFVVDCPTHWNMTKEDYLNNITGSVPDRETGKEILEDWLKPFSHVIEHFVPRNMSCSKFKNIIKEMSE